MVVDTLFFFRGEAKGRLRRESLFCCGEGVCGGDWVDCLLLIV